MPEFNRRSLAKGVAWSAPVVVAATTLPALAASTDPQPQFCPAVTGDPTAQTTVTGKVATIFTANAPTTTLNFNGTDSPYFGEAQTGPFDAPTGNPFYNPPEFPPVTSVWGGAAHSSSFSTGYVTDSSGNALDTAGHIIPGLAPGYVNFGWGGQPSADQPHHLPPHPPTPPELFRRPVM